MTLAAATARRQRPSTLDTMRELVMSLSHDLALRVAKISTHSSGQVAIETEITTTTQMILGDSAQTLMESGTKFNRLIKY